MTSTSALSEPNGARRVVPEEIYAGKVTDIDKDDFKMTVRSGDLSRTFLVDRDAQILLSNGSRATLSELREGDRVLVYYTHVRGKDCAERIVPQDIGYSQAEPYGATTVVTEPVAPAVIERQYTGTITAIDTTHGTLNLNIANPSKENAELTLDRLFVLLRDRLAARHPGLAGSKPAYGPPRRGDVLHSLADIGKACRLLGYAPTHSIERGLDESLSWYETHLRP